MLFEKVYALYRLRRFDEAAKSLALVPAASRDEGWVHLEAQIMYQSGQYARAVELYERVFVQGRKGKDVELDAELKSNICAAFIAANQAAKIPVFLKQCGHRQEDENFELSYNIASGLVDVGELDTALTALTSAHGMYSCAEVSLSFSLSLSLSLCV